MKRCLILSFGIFAVSVFALSFLGAYQADTGPLNLLIISMDTVRLEDLDLADTPAIDKFKKISTVYSNCIAPAPLTLPSNCSLLTGQYPATHGVRANGTYELSPSATTLAEILKQKGYSTAAVVSGFPLDHIFGMDQGFDEYNDVFEVGGSLKCKNYKGHEVESFERLATETTRVAVDWLRLHRGERYFLFVHYYDPHAPYEPPEEWRADGDFKEYWGEIAFVDDQLKNLLEEIDMNNTIIVLVADHGESFGEHGLGTNRQGHHGTQLFDEALRVPLLVYSPGAAPATNDQLVSLVDIVPSVLETLGCTVPATLDGEGLDIGHPFVLSETLHRFPHQYGLRTKEWKLILSISGEGATEAFLYNLEDDPEERDNVAADHPAIVKTFLGKIETYLGVEKKEEKALIDKRSRAKLRALGYL